MNVKKWFRDILDKYKDDPEFIAEYNQLLKEESVWMKTKLRIGANMKDTSLLYVGAEVHYQPDHYKDDQWENGLVKELRPPDGVWVVYNCAGNWHRYTEYTGCKTHLRDLKMGWRT